MSDPDSASPGDATQPRPRFLKRILASKVIMLSIAVHILFGLGATLYIVQTIETKRKTTFAGGPATPNASTRSLEHQINMARKQQTMSAPAQAKRIVSTGLSKISLPDMPSIPGATDMVPDKMPGMGGMGVGFGMGAGGAAGGGGAGGLTLFGMHDSGVGLPGHMYDLKQLQDHSPSNVTSEDYTEIVQNFVHNGWHENDFSKKYFRAPTTLYAAQIFTPEFPADLAPKAFNVENVIQPRFWVALYRGLVSPPESGVYHFVGAGDDVLMVRFNGANVLDRCWEMQIRGRKPVAPVTKNYSYDWAIADPSWKFGSIPNGFARGPGITVEAGEFYPIEILIGEQPGGFSGFALLVEEDGVNYDKDPKGNPILPIFRVANQPLPPPIQGAGRYAPHIENGSIWLSKPPPPEGDLGADASSGARLFFTKANMPAPSFLVMAGRPVAAQISYVSSITDEAQ